MKKFMLVAVGLFATLVLMSTRSHAADATFGTDFATAYVFRGLAVSDRAVMQPYLEVTPEKFPLTLGVWANYGLASDSSGDPKSAEFSEVDLYAAYEIPLGIDWLSLSVGYNEYTYPTGDADADREASVVAALEGFYLRPELGVYPGLGGSYAGAVYMEGSLSREEKLYDKLTGTLGVATGVQFQGSRSDADDGFSFAKIGLDFGYEFAKAGVAYYFETDKDVQEVKENWVGMVGVAFEF